MTGDDEPPEPFASLAKSTGRDDDAVEELFSRHSPEPADTDAVWQALSSDHSPPVETEETIVSKAAYCERCPHLTPPPDVRCTHPGTEIIDFPDSEHVRVRACPYAADDRAPPPGHE